MNSGFAYMVAIHMQQSFLFYFGTYYKIVITQHRSINQNTPLQFGSFALHYADFGGYLIIWIFRYSNTTLGFQTFYRNLYCALPCSECDNSCCIAITYYFSNAFVT